MAPDYRFCLNMLDLITTGITASNWCFYYFVCIYWAKIWNVNTFQLQHVLCLHTPVAMWSCFRLLQNWVQSSNLYIQNIKHFYTFGETCNQSMWYRPHLWTLQTLSLPIKCTQFCDVWKWLWELGTWASWILFSLLGSRNHCVTLKQRRKFSTLISCA